MALIRCSECGSDVSDRALTCIKCGNPLHIPSNMHANVVIEAEQNDYVYMAKKASKMLGAAALVLAVIVAVPVGYMWVTGPSSAAHSTTGGEVSAAAPQVVATPDQAPVERSRVANYGAYQSAANEIQASAIFNRANLETDQAIQGIDGKVSNWVGKVSTISTSHGGGTVNFDVTSPYGVVYRTDSDVDAGSGMYTLLSNLQIGQTVFFSGKLIPGISSGKWEKSLTERGSLEKPVFDVAFTYIGADPEPSATVSPPANSTAKATSMPLTYKTSFDCSKAKSDAEHLICSDQDLATNDLALSGIYLTAKAAATDQAALREMTRQAWNYRERNCHDRDCLMAWYQKQQNIYLQIASTGILPDLSPAKEN